jgi:hypothetical protein
VRATAPVRLPSIHEAFTCVDDCPRCMGEGVVCEARPWLPMDGMGTDRDCGCGAPGMPCREVVVYDGPGP